MIYLFTSLMFGFLGLSTMASAEQPKLEEKYTEIFARIEHLSVDFSQKTYKKLRDRTALRSGNAYFSKPGMFRWNFSSDKNGLEEYYFNGEKLTHYREKEKLVNHYNTNAGLARELQDVVNLVLDPKILLNRYKVKEIKTQGAQTLAVLVPSDPESSELESIFVRVSDSKKFVEEVQLFYTDGNHTQFSFKNPSKKSIDPKIFNFSRQGNFTIRHHG